MPASVGENRMEIEQLAPAARLVPHWFVTRKKFGEALILTKLSLPDPVLVTVTDWGALVVPTGCIPKLIEPDVCTSFEVSGSV